MTPLDKCLAEQARCRDYLDGPGEDKAGAWMGMTDWLMEEVILRTMKRIYHPYTNWEDYLNGMWNAMTREQEDDMLAKAIEFTGDAELYGAFMMRVIVEWPNACEHNLTNDSLNQLAWVGHAAACMAIQCPEYITRRAWGFLTDEQRERANAKAQYAVDMWRHGFRLNGAQYAFKF